MGFYGDGTAAGWKARDTSREAASDLGASLERRQRQVYRVLLKRGPLCCDEVAEILGIPVTSVRPRVTEMTIRGLVRPDGRRISPITNKSQIAWCVCAPGEVGKYGTNDNRNVS